MGKQTHTGNKMFAAIISREPKKIKQTNKQTEGLVSNRKILHHHHQKSYASGIG